jgi:hypothetical protein
VQSYAISSSLRKFFSPLSPTQPVTGYSWDNVDRYPLYQPPLKDHMYRLSAAHEFGIRTGLRWQVRGEGYETPSFVALS